MEIRPEILDRHLADAAIEQLADDYTRKGFDVARDVPMGDARADLVARKGESLVVFEVKTGDWTEERRAQAQHLRDRAVHEGGRFVLVMLPQPREKSVEVEGIKEILLRVVREQCRAELSDLSDSAEVVEISDVDLRSLSAGPEGIDVEGSAYVDLELHPGSGSNGKASGSTSAESVPLDFHLVLTHDLQPRQVVRLDLDLKDLHT